MSVPPDEEIRSGKSCRWVNVVERVPRDPVTWREHRRGVVKGKQKIGRVKSWSSDWSRVKWQRGVVSRGSVGFHVLIGCWPYRPWCHINMSAGMQLVSLANNGQAIPDREFPIHRTIHVTRGTSSKYYTYYLNFDHSPHRKSLFVYRTRAVRGISIFSKHSCEWNNNDFEIITVTGVSLLKKIIFFMRKECLNYLRKMFKKVYLIN